MSGMKKRREFRTRKFRISDLILVGEAPPPDVPPLGVGDWCIYNSGSRPLLVVDIDPENVVVAWDDDEHVLPRACVRRAK